MQRKVGRLVAEGDIKAARKLQKRFLRGSVSARVYATKDAYAKMRGRTRQVMHKRVHTTAELMEIAQKLNPIKPIDEPVRVSAANKGASEWRPIMTFGIQRRAATQLAKMEIEMAHTSEPNQFGITNGGQPAAIQCLKRAIDDGARFFVELDIISCYATADHNLIHPYLPSSMSRQVAKALLNNAGLHNVAPGCAGLNNVVTGYIGTRVSGPSYLLQTSRQGMPQGSPLSSLALEVVCRKVLLGMPHLEVDLVNYADNFGILARTRREATEAADALRRVLAHTCGCFLVKTTKARRVADGFDFLGTTIRRQKDIVHVMPSERNRQRFLDRSRHYLGKLDRLTGSAEEVPSNIYRARVEAQRFRSYLASYRGNNPLYEWAQSVTTEAIVGRIKQMGVLKTEKLAALMPELPWQPTPPQPVRSWFPTTAQLSRLQRFALRGAKLDPSSISRKHTAGLRSLRSLLLLVECSTG